MPTSRTGTTQGKRFRQETLRAAINAGQTHCPDCQVQLAWGTSKQPDSPEADHITPHSRGGTDRPDNGRVICRHCNQSRGNRSIRKRPESAHRTATNTTLINW